MYPIGYKKHSTASSSFSVADSIAIVGKKSRIVRSALFKTAISTPSTSILMNAGSTEFSAQKMSSALAATSLPLLARDMPRLA